MLEPAHGSLGGVCDREEGTAGGSPTNCGWAASGRQVCSAWETLAGFVFEELGEGEPRQAGFLLDKIKDSQNQGNSCTATNLKWKSN